jgi:hypothetical protein
MTRATTYAVVVGHARQAPVSNRFRYRTRSWLVDLDDVPRLPRGVRWLASFDSRDHLGDPADSLRDNLHRFLSAHGVDTAVGRVLMLANSRALGRAVNPISIHWCYAAADDSLVAVVAEVHNTYGDRHAYLLPADGSARGDDTTRVGAERIDATVDKAMYVSPFNPVDGTYHIVVSPPGEQVSVTVTLHREGQPPFVASLQGRREPARPVVVAAVRTVATSIRTATLIRWQGVRLFLRGLRVEPRPVHPPQKAVS